MKEIKLDMLKEYQRPIVKIDNIDAIIDTGALIPVFSLPSHIDDHSEMFTEWESLSRYITDYGIEKRKIERAIPEVETYISTV